MLEGIDGSGKTTQAALLLRWLEERGCAALLVREPGGTTLGEELRRLLLESRTMPARSELLLMLAARSALVSERVLPALEEGAVVIADRFELSTLAYQGHGRGLPLEEVRRLNRFATEGLRPDLVVLLSVPPELGAGRRGEGGRTADRMEREGAAFTERVARAYGLLAGTEDNVIEVDGTPAPDRVHVEILRLLGGHFPETFEPGEG